MTANKKVRWKKMKKGSQDMALNITSMADIFTIILVFLLKSFSAEGSSLTPNLKLQLPSARHGTQIAETMKVEIGSDAIQVDGQVAAKLQNFEFNPSEIAQTTQLHAGIDRAITAIRAKQPLTAPKDGKPSPESHLTIMADYKTPYNTLKTVLASAANHGYVNYRLVVVKEED